MRSRKWPLGRGALDIGSSVTEEVCAEEADEARVSERPCAGRLEFLSDHKKCEDRKHHCCAVV